jgi:hypothetical protein
VKRWYPTITLRGVTTQKTSTWSFRIHKVNFDVMHVNQLVVRGKCKGYVYLSSLSVIKMFLLSIYLDLWPMYRHKNISLSGCVRLCSEAFPSGIQIVRTGEPGRNKCSRACGRHMCMIVANENLAYRGSNKWLP